MSNVEPWLSEPVIRQLLTKLLGRLERCPASERVRLPGMRITPRTLPVLFESDEPGEPEYAWRLVEKLAERGWIVIDEVKPVPGKASYELMPYVRLVVEMEDVMRATAAIATRPDYASQWSAALADRRDIPQSLVAYLKRRPLRIAKRSATEVIDRLLSIRALPHQALFLREVSGRVFWGDAKILDHRSVLVARILGVADCPFPELPVSVLSHCPFDEIEGVLFVENDATFLSPRVREQAQRSGLAMLLASGFKLAAARIRDPHGSNLYLQAPLPGRAAAIGNRLSAWLHGEGPDWPVLFWGDLDFAGLEILKRLRRGFPQMTAWRQAYSPLVMRLQAGDGFEFADSEKPRQVDPGYTGCAYADEVLLPAIRSAQRFCHQEY